LSPWLDYRRVVVLVLAQCPPISADAVLLLAAQTGCHRVVVSEGDMVTTCDHEETVGVAIAGISLTYALAGILKRVGLLDPEAIENAFEAALSSVENSFLPSDAAAMGARQLLELMASELAVNVTPLGSTEAAPVRTGNSLAERVT
jgi:hypothetical protein